jgi:CheY-like chemotaxis protein
MEQIRTLVIDDNENMRKLMREFLSILGLRNVRTLSNGESALKVLEYNETHLVITDLKMQPMSGLDFIAAVRSGKNIANPAIPIVVVTGFADLKTVQQLNAAGASGVLVKPVSLVALRERVLPLLPLARELEPDQRPGSWAFQI